MNFVLQIQHIQKAKYSLCHTKRRNLWYM